MSVSSESDLKHISSRSPQKQTQISPMRIRKRPVPLPLSSLSPVPLPDPHLLNLNHCSSSPMVQQQLQTHDDPKPSNPPPRNPSHHMGPPHPRPSDHPNPRPPPPIGASSNGCDFSGEQERKNYFPVSEIITTHLSFLLYCGFN